MSVETERLASGNETKRLADLLDRLCEQLPTMQDRETVWCMIRGDDLREVVRLLTAMQTPELMICTRCGGSGEVPVMTNHLGPDDYEVSGLCPICDGTGAVLG